jgi:hypothetical protein
MNTGKNFADYKQNGYQWITLISGEYYPDILKDACELYQPVLVIFGQLLARSESSKALLYNIATIDELWMRIQLSRVFRKYVSPETPVEMLKKKTKVENICKQFGDGFRPIQEVHAAFNTRSIPDEAICALLWEYKDRGKKGYSLTEKFFALFRSQFPDLQIKGPEKAGKDILMRDIFPEYNNPKRPVDFAIYKNREVLAIGLARYDSDRGGAQEDDRIGGYRNCADELLRYINDRHLKTKVIFINDGPGLLLGSMWDDYASLENSGHGRILVSTLRMLNDRLTRGWLES